MATIELDHDLLLDLCAEDCVGVKRLYERLLNNPIGTGYRFTSGGIDLVVFFTPMKSHKHDVTSLSFCAYTAISSNSRISLAEVSYLTDMMEMTGGELLESIRNLPKDAQPIHIGMWNQYMDDYAEASDEQFNSTMADQLFSHKQYVEFLRDI